MTEQLSKCVIYDSPSQLPNKSLHWQRILGDGATNKPYDKDFIHSHKELIGSFKADVDSFKSCDIRENYTKVALWSCIIGYCEALSTHKDKSRRYSIFPIPLEAINRLVGEFIELLERIPKQVNKVSVERKCSKTKDKPLPKSQSLHRCTVQSLSNSIWKRAQNKNQMKDELHANSLYICLCGDVDNKSLDCFGAALLTVIGMNIIGFGSLLTLSEDHAYESHWESNEGANIVIDDTRVGSIKSYSSSEDNNICVNGDKSKKRATCEVAITGNTKESQSKRGMEISETFINLKSTLTPDTSWLYMASNPVLCDTPGMVLAAVLGNVNCDVEKVKKTSGHDDKPQLVSSTLYKLKRDMLWILYDAKYMIRFPFALMELGECEEHFGSERGMQWVNVGDLVQNNDDCVCAEDMVNNKSMMVLWNEKLFLDAINVSKTVYHDSQVYPYLYAGHYHKDAGRKSSTDEYRLVEALRLYSQAAFIASKYKYEAKGCMQLMKHMTTVASLIQKDILLLPRECQEDQKEVRSWINRENYVSSATWVLGFYDSLLFWEEKEENSFVEILTLTHKFSIAKIFQFFPYDVRVDAIAIVHNPNLQKTIHSVITENEMFYFRKPRSGRLTKESRLIASLTKPKIVIRDLDMTLPTVGSTRQRKRTRRSGDY